MAIAPHIKELMNSKDASVIRRMFEEGALLKSSTGKIKYMILALETLT